MWSSATPDENRDKNYVGVKFKIYCGHPGVESVGIDKHQTFVANLMKLGLTFYGSAFKLFEKFCFNALLGMKKSYQMHSFSLRYSSKKWRAQFIKGKMWPRT